MSVSLRGREPLLSGCFIREGAACISYWLFCKKRPPPLAFVSPFGAARSLIFSNLEDMCGGVFMDWEVLLQLTWL